MKPTNILWLQDCQDEIERRLSLPNRKTDKEKMNEEIEREMKRVKDEHNEVF